MKLTKETLKSKEFLKELEEVIDDSYELDYEYVDIGHPVSVYKISESTLKLKFLKLLEKYSD